MKRENQSTTEESTSETKSKTPGLKEVSTAKSANSQRGNRRTRREHWKDSKSRTHGHNDLSWLTYNSNFADIVSRFPFGKPLGAHFDSKGFSATGPVSGKFSIAGICTIRGLFTAGKALDINAPINQVGLGIWTNLRHSGTGSLVDDPNDVSIYFIAIGQALAYLGWLRRIVAEFTAMNPLNLYTIRGLVTAEGLAYDDLRSHLAELIAYTQWYAMQLNNLIFPKLPYFEDAYCSFHYIYRDDSLAKGQYYMKSPAMFGRLNETYDQEGSAIQYGITTIDASIPTWHMEEYIAAGTDYDYLHLRALGDMLLTPLINSQFVATLGAAILKAYGESGIFRVADIDMLEERLDITMDAEIAMQFHNTRVFDSITGGKFGYKSHIPSVSGGVSPYLTVIDDSMYEGAIFRAESANDVRDIPNLLDLYSDQPSNAEVLLGSRMLGAASLIKNEGDVLCVYLEAHDTFIATSFEVYYINASGDLASNTIANSFIDMDNAPVGTLRGTVSALLNLLTFTGAPHVTCILPGNVMNVAGTFHSPISVSSQFMKDIYTNNILSLFNIPKFK